MPTAFLFRTVRDFNSSDARVSTSLTKRFIWDDFYFNYSYYEHYACLINTRKLMNLLCFKMYFYIIIFADNDFAS